MKTITRNRSIALATLAAVGATTFGGVAVQPASANSKTWKKVAIGAGAVTAYGLLSGKQDLAAVGGIATVGSYLKYKSEREDEHRQEYRRDHRRYDYRDNRGNSRYRW